MCKVAIFVCRHLGINIDSNLTFYDHVAKVCRKAAMQINIMKRLGKFLDFNGRLKIYDSFFLQNFNYCPLVYNSMYARNENNIERLNKRMLRVVCNDRLATYSELLVKVKRTTMYCNRRKALAELVFNVLHNLSPPLPHNLFTKQFVMYDMRDNYMLVQPRFRTTKHGYKSIAYQGAKMWNSPLVISRFSTIIRLLNQSWQNGLL